MTTKDNKLEQSRAHSFSSFDLQHAFNNRGQQNNNVNNRTRHISSEVESLVMANAPSRKMSLSSLASSTFSYLTGSTSITTKEPDSITDAKGWRDYKGMNLKFI